jgi:hypothetical protein
MQLVITFIQAFVLPSHFPASRLHTIQFHISILSLCDLVARRPEYVPAQNCDTVFAVRVTIKVAIVGPSISRVSEEIREGERHGLSRFIDLELCRLTLGCSSADRGDFGFKVGHFPCAGGSCGSWSSCDAVMLYWYWK